MEYDISKRFQKISSALKDVSDVLQSNDLVARVQDGMPAAELHSFYNQVGLKEGWLKPEYATPLSEQDKTNQVKNVDAALDVVDYWISRFEGNKFSEMGREGLIGAMESCVDYEGNRGLFELENAAESQHNQWRSFIGTYQKERITPGHEKFREDNYNQFNMDYPALEESVKDQDRLIVAVISDVVLGLADIGYERVIDTN
ncbi:hypothetical protein HOE04_03600 [archaeon]|jgi:hypothetical protein|nr:hypothetical protein [archaeon]